jgi:hypothetical protein
MIGSESSAIGALAFILAVLAVAAIPFCMIGDLGRARAIVFSAVLTACVVGGGGLVMVETGFWHPAPIAWGSAVIAVALDVYLLRTDGPTSGATTSIRSIPALPPLESVPTPAIWSYKLHSFLSASSPGGGWFSWPISKPQVWFRVAVDHSVNSRSSGSRGSH